MGGLTWVRVAYPTVYCAFGLIPRAFECSVNHPLAEVVKYVHPPIHARTGLNAPFNCFW
jgi:hypothetical protein